MGAREDVERLSDHLDLFHYLEPVNSEEERERFLAAVEEDRAYNPSYTYRDVPHLDEARQLLDRLDDAADGTLEQRMVDGLRGRLRMIEAIGSAAVTERSREHYGSPDDSLVAAARERFQQPAGEAADVIDGEQLLAAFEALFDELGVSYGCDLVAADIIRNNPREKRILVPENKTYTRDSAKRLLVHESTHSVRTVNGLAAGALPLVYGTQGYEVAEEGLATFNEQELGVFANTVPRITARVVAVAAADESFHALYQEMRDLGLDRRTAFIRAYRVKRGLQDTSQPGGFIKDHIYFQGYSRITDSPALADQLYAGKVGFDDVAAVDSVPSVSRDDHIAACERVAADILQ